jgi:hypothetical protein
MNSFEKKESISSVSHPIVMLTGLEFQLVLSWNGYLAQHVRTTTTTTK